MKIAFGGQNRTGVSRAPELAAEMIAAPKKFPPSSAGDASGIAKVRVDYARNADPIGTMPPADGVRGLAETALRTVSGRKPTLLLDKLGERMAFECAGTRLYEGLISKHDAGRTFRGGPSREDLVHIRDQEREHFALVGVAIKKLGGDPTVLTPSAEVHAVASKGLPAVVADPRTDLLQCLEVMLTAELIDNDCWPALIELAEQAGEKDLVRRFGNVLESEREHLARVRGWVAAGSGRSVEQARRSGAETKREPLRAQEPSGGRRQSGRRARPQQAAAAGRGRTPGARKRVTRKVGRGAKGKARSR
jgi:hypothetical protein